MSAQAVALPQIHVYTANPTFLGRGVKPGCRGAGVDPEWWFSDFGSNYTKARPICLACPLLEECREFAIATEQSFGMWGGLSPEGLRVCRNGRCVHPQHRRRRL